MISVITAEQARADDAQAVAWGMAASTLMEVAGAKAAGYLEGVLPAGEVAVVVGSGRNGGDGLVVARYLARGRPTSVVLLHGEPRFEGAADLLRAAERYGARLLDDAQLNTVLNRSRAVVDAILGTGVRFPLRPWAQRAIQAINDSGLPVYALDIPSGVDANSGQVADAVIDAVATVTFGASKWGHWCAPGAERRGRLVLADIGLPAHARDRTRVVEGEMLAQWLKPLRADGHKYHRGRVAVIGGSRNMPGAPQLAAEAALRMGVGLVQLMVPRSVAARISVSPAILVQPADEDADGRLILSATDLRAVSAMDALVVGPGLGLRISPQQIARVIQLGKPTVIDADALVPFARLAQRTHPAPLVLTPHEGELARMLETDSGWVKSDRQRAFAMAWERFRAALVLKGPFTVAGRPGATWLNPTGTPVLATAGSGDVLAGMAGGLLAAGYPDWQVAAMSPFLHGLAGHHAFTRHGESVIATDLIDQLAEGWKGWPGTAPAVCERI